MLFLSHKLLQSYRGRPVHIFTVSVLVYIVINMIENYIHYTLGRNTDATKPFEFFLPSTIDWSYMVIVMIVFAIIQGAFTIIIDSYWDSK